MFKTLYRFPAQNRLKRPETIFSDSFVLKFSKNNLAFSRFGFIVSKKIDKRAVTRNKLKRTFRACLEIMQSQIMQGYDILFILNPKAKAKPREALYNEIAASLKTKGMNSLEVKN